VDRAARHNEPQPGDRGDLAAAHREDVEQLEPDITIETLFIDGLLRGFGAPDSTKT